jgi:cytochrome c oxidase subunit 2
MSRWIEIRLSMCLSILFVAPSFAADDIANCVLCHGTNLNGNAAIRAPKLSGMEPWYLRHQLALFRSGARGTNPKDVSGGEMRIIALALRADAIDKIVAAIAASKSKAPAVTVEGDIPRGYQLYASCAGCHGLDGRGNEVLHAPALANRSDWYLVTQLNNYREGLRGIAVGDEYGMPMRAAALMLPSDQSVADVVAYINTLR